MKTLAPNTMLQSRYKISGLIGKGGMGEVYLATDERLGHAVALKRTTVGGDVGLAEAFEQEARTLAQLRHPVLPKVSDHFVEDDEQFLVMEYIDGMDLAKRLKSTAKPFPLNWVLFWADQLLEALEYLHTHKPPIIHRDIKPQNLKLTGENQVILLDFGLSKRSIGDTRVTSSGSVVGYTPHYAPMEQIRGTGTNARSDIYSLSATLYQLLSNQVPPDALTRADAMLAGSNDPIESLTKHNDEVSEQISDIILHGMELSQDKRIPNAREMQKELRKAFNQLKSSMSAETVAFNIQDDGIVEADAKTEVISSEDIVEATPEVAATIASIPAEEISAADVVGDAAPSEEAVAANQQTQDFSADKTEIIDASAVQEVAADADFDSTMKKDFYAEDVIDTSPGESPEEAAPSVFETSEEVAPAEAYHQEAEPSDIEDQFATSDNVAVGGSGDAFVTSDDASKAGDFAPEATVPLISLDGEETGVSEEPVALDETTNFDTTGESFVDDDQESDTGFGQTQAFEEEEEKDEEVVSAAEFEEVESEAEEEEDSVPSAAAAADVAAGKSSTGKYLAILGGLGAVLVLLLVSAGAVGWYLTNGGFGFGSSSPGDSTTTEQPTEVQNPVDSTDAPETTDSDPDQPEITETDPSETETADTSDEPETSDENPDTGDETADTTGDTTLDTEPAETKTTTGSKTTRTSTKTTTRKSTDTRTTRKPTKTTKTKPKRTTRTKPKTTTKKPAPKKTKKTRDPGILQ